jgi:hypothetical protein
VAGEPPRSSSGKSPPAVEPLHGSVCMTEKIRGREREGESRRSPNTMSGEVRSPASMGKPLPSPPFSVVRERHESGNDKLGFG